MERFVEKIYASLLDVALIKSDNHHDDDSLQCKEQEQKELNENDEAWERVLRKGKIVHTMKGFCGVVLRIQLGEESIIIKLASTNAKMRPLLKHQYRNEVEFCNYLMKSESKQLFENLPRIFASGYVNEAEQLFYIVMEDCGNGELDQLSDCSIGDATQILSHWQRVQREIGCNLSDLNVRSLFYSFINGVLFFEFGTLEIKDNIETLLVNRVCEKLEEDWSTFLDVVKELDWAVYEDTTLQDFHTLIDLTNLVANVRNSLKHIQNDLTSAVHGDFRLDNIIKKGNCIRFIDFQSTSKGPLLYDFSHFTAQSLSILKRRKVEHSLLLEYYQSAGCDDSLSWESFLQSYKHCIALQMCYCVLGIGSHWKYYLHSGKLKDPEFLKEKSARVGKDIIARTCHLYIDHCQ